MDFTVEEIEKLKYKAVASLTWKEIEPDYNRLLIEFSKNGIPGFRPNKITPKAIEARYGKKIKENLLEDVSNKFLHEIISGKKLFPCGVSNVEIIEYKKGEGINFEATIVQQGKINIPDYSKIDVPEDCENMEDFKEVLSTELSKMIDFEIPQSIIDMEVKMSVETGENEPLDVIIERTKLLLLLNEIAKDENIVTSEEEFEARIQNMADEYNITTERLKEFLITTNGLNRVKLFQISEDVIDKIAAKKFKK